MRFPNTVSVYVIFYFRVVLSDRRFVNYTIVTTGTSAHSGRRACAEKYADNEYFAAKINDVTGVCTGLTWSWGRNQQYDPGFSYLMKIKTIKIYQPAVSFF
jgi:hypothetical protein